MVERLLDHYANEHTEANEHLDLTILEFREMKMQPWLERALGRKPVGVCDLVGGLIWPPPSVHYDGQTDIAADETD